jgi:hypothetical protein
MLLVDSPTTYGMKISGTSIGTKFSHLWQEQPRFFVLKVETNMLDASDSGKALGIQAEADLG